MLAQRNGLLAARNDRHWSGSNLLHAVAFADMPDHVNLCMRVVLRM